jgi:hypothetical protein
LYSSTNPAIRQEQHRTFTSLKRVLKLPKSEIQKNNFGSKQSSGFFSSTIQALRLPWAMTKNELGDQYQRCSDGTFLDFYSDYHPDLYCDMHHPDNFTTKNRGPSKVVSFDSDGLIYSIYKSALRFIFNVQEVH